MITKQVELTKLSEALGRNGTMKVKAINMTVFPDGQMVEIAPINSQGNIGRCNIAVSIDDLSAVIVALQEIQTGITEK